MLFLNLDTLLLLLNNNNLWWCILSAARLTERHTLGYASLSLLGALRARNLKLALNYFDVEYLSLIFY